MAEYSTDIRHVSGESNVVADALSRPSVPDTSVSDDLPPALVDECLVGAVALSPGLDLAALATSQKSPEATAEFLPLSSSASSLQLRDVPLPHPHAGVLICDVSQASPRPLVPRSWISRVFDCLHGISHAGGKATLKEISRRFVWKGMRADVLRLSRACQDCASSKISRHIHSPLVQRPVPLERFSSLHVDLVGPLPVSEGYSYLFTIIDRTTRWLEAVPLVDITAASCATALLRHWICRFGVPTDVTSDQGRQFVSALWQELHCALGITSLRTTAYHPQANGMVERVHRVLKERLMARSRTPAWMEHLPLVLLGIRTSVRQDLQWCPAELVYGATLRLPGEFISSSEPGTSSVPSTAFVTKLRASLASMRPAPSVHHRPPALGPPGIPSSLLGVSHVYVRVDAIRRPLTRPYEGPFLVLSRTPKTFVISRAGKSWTVTVDRLKPALGFLAAASGASSAATGAVAAEVPAEEVAVAPPSPDPASVAPRAPVLTRSSRVSRPPASY